MPFTTFCSWNNKGLSDGESALPPLSQHTSQRFIPIYIQILVIRCFQLAVHIPECLILFQRFCRLIQSSRRFQHIYKTIHRGLITSLIKSKCLTDTIIELCQACSCGPAAALPPAGSFPASRWYPYPRINTFEVSAKTPPVLYRLICLFVLFLL